MAAVLIRTTTSPRCRRSAWTHRVAVRLFLAAGAVLDRAEVDGRRAFPLDPYADER